MTIRILIAIAVASALASGCATAPPTTVAAWTLCNVSQPGAQCNVNIVRNDGGKYACELGRFDVNPDFLEFRGGRAVNVRFTLPSGFEFCTGDGAALKAGSLTSSYPQLYESFGADKDDGSRVEATKACHPFWIWHWGNTNAGSEHEYLIRFRDTSGRQCKIDPFFKNG